MNPIPARAALAASLLVALAGCNPDSDPRRGYTACGDFPTGPVECQPGQYCADATFSECVPGCTSDENCASSQTCEKAAGESVGDCQNSGPPPGFDAGPPTGSDAGPPVSVDAGPLEDLVALCRDNCQSASFTCGDGSITATDVAACDAWCRDGATADSDRESFIACVEAAFFTAPICDEADCLP